MLTQCGNSLTIFVINGYFGDINTWNINTRLLDKEIKRCAQQNNGPVASRFYLQYFPFKITHEFVM